MRRRRAVLAGAGVLAVALAACGHTTGGGPPLPQIQVSGAPLSDAAAQTRYGPVLADLEGSLGVVYGNVVWESPGLHSRAWDGCGGVVGPRAATTTPSAGDGDTQRRAVDAVTQTLTAHGFASPEQPPHAGPGTILRSRDAAGAVADVTVGTTSSIQIIYAAEPGHCA